MQTREQIQRAHDILHTVVVDHPGVVKDKLSLFRVGAMVSALCWVLEHDHNTTFAHVLACVEAEFQSRGAVLKRAPAPFVGRPPGDDG